MERESRGIQPGKDSQRTALACGKVRQANNGQQTGNEVDVSQVYAMVFRPRMRLPFRGFVPRASGLGMETKGSLSRTVIMGLLDLDDDASSVKACYLLKLMAIPPVIHFLCRLWGYGCECGFFANYQ